jgi:hypothetical protein
MTKKIIYLSLKDLKELGIIKKRRRRKTQLLKPIVQGIRQNSDHMQGFATNYFKNSTDLASKNLEENTRALILRNNAIENDIKNNKNNTIEFNDQINKLQREINNQQNNYYYLTGQLTRNGFSDDDNIDVPISSGKLMNQGNAPERPVIEEINDPINESMFYPSPLKTDGTPPPKTKKQINEENRQLLRDTLISMGETDNEILNDNNQKRLNSRIKELKKEVTTLVGKYKLMNGEKQEILKSNNKIEVQNAIKKLERQQNKKKSK